MLEDRFKSDGANCDHGDKKADSVARPNDFRPRECSCYPVDSVHGVNQTVRYGVTVTLPYGFTVDTILCASPLLLP